MEEGGFWERHQPIRSMRQEIQYQLEYPGMDQKMTFRGNMRGAGSPAFHHPLVDTDLLQAIYWTPAEHFVTPTEERALIRKAAAPFLPERIQKRYTKGPFMQDISHRLSETMPVFKEMIPDFQQNGIWDDIIDTRAIAEFSKFLDDPQRDPKYLYPVYRGTVFKVTLPYFVGRYLQLQM